MELRDLSVGFVTGFMPASAGQPAAAGQPGMSHVPTEALDAFGALLSAFTGLPAADSELPAPAAELQATLGALLTQPPPDAPALPQGDTGLAPDLLAGLIDQLTALGETGAAPLDPAAERHLTDAIDALAAALGIEFPIEANTTPVAIATPLTGPDAAGAAPQGALPNTEGDTAPSDASLLASRLADKLTELAATLAPSTPELATKLAVLATRLASGEIDQAMLAKLGLDPLADTPSDVAAAIERLLATRPETRPAGPFGNATLTLPDIALPKSAMGASDGRPPGAAAEPADARPAAEVRTTERSDKPTSQARDSFQAAFQASLATDAAPQNTGSAPPTAVVVGTAVAVDTRAIHAAYRAPVQQVNIPQMAVEIVGQVEAGNSRFQIRLDPPELGRIDVKLDVDNAGNVSARLTVERAETLDLMQRDQRALEKALAQAGLDSTKTNLEFSLRQNMSGRDGQQQQGGDSQPVPRFGIAEAGDDAVSASQVSAYRGHVSADGVNLFV